MATTPLEETVKLAGDLVTQHGDQVKHAEWLDFPSVLDHAESNRLNERTG